MRGSAAISLGTTARRAMWPRFAIMLLAGALLGLAVQRPLVSLVIIRGQSMAPSVDEGQACLCYRSFAPPTRGDVVVVHDGESRALKRVVGLPNESLFFQSGRVFVNGRPLPEPYLDRAIKTYPVFRTRFTLGHDQYFVMGDNRSQSEDSRVYGPLPRVAIVGTLAPGLGWPRPMRAFPPKSPSAVTARNGEAMESHFARLARSESR